MSMIKYRVHEVAKDFNVTSKVISQILTDYIAPPKNHMQVLENHELDVIFEYMTQHNQAASLEDIFKVPEKPAATAKKEAAPEKTAAAPEKKPAQQSTAPAQPQQPQGASVQLLRKICALALDPSIEDAQALENVRALCTQAQIFFREQGM